MQHSFVPQIISQAVLTPTARSTDPREREGQEKKEKHDRGVERGRGLRDAAPHCILDLTTNHSKTACLDLLFTETKHYNPFSLGGRFTSPVLLEVHELREVGDCVLSSQHFPRFLGRPEDLRCQHVVSSVRQGPACDRLQRRLQAYMKVRVLREYVAVILGGHQQELGGRSTCTVWLDQWLAICGYEGRR